MSILISDMKRAVAQQRLGFMATVGADGTPNLSPKGQTFVLDDDHLVIGEVRSPRTRTNLAHQPVAEINVVDPIARKGFRFKGPCTVVSEGDRYQELVAFLKAHGAIATPNAVMVMKVERALPLISPGYDTGVTEEDMRRRWKSHYDDLNSDL